MKIVIRTMLGMAAALLLIGCGGSSQQAAQAQQQQQMREALKIQKRAKENQALHVYNSKDNQAIENYNNANPTMNGSNP